MEAGLWRAPPGEGGRGVQDARGTEAAPPCALSVPGLAPLLRDRHATPTDSLDWAPEARLFPSSGSEWEAGHREAAMPGEEPRLPHSSAGLGLGVRATGTYLAAERQESRPGHPGLTTRSKHCSPLPPVTGEGTLSCLEFLRLLADVYDFTIFLLLLFLW